MKSNTLKLLILFFSISNLSGCAKFWDSAAANGGVFASEKAPYIVINSSGGTIQDVYLLNNSIVQSPETSDGWLFLDNQNNPVYLGGDVKTIRLTSSNKSQMFEQYVEFHIETDGFKYPTYFDKLKTKI